PGPHLLFAGSAALQCRSCGVATSKTRHWSGALPAMSGPGGPRSGKTMAGLVATLLLRGAMQFDAQTLYFTNVVVLFIAAATAFLYGLQHRDQMAMLEGALATAVGGVGTLILGIVRSVPPMVPGVVGNALVAAGFLLAWESM